MFDLIKNEANPDCLSMPAQHRTRRRSRHSLTSPQSTPNKSSVWWQCLISYENKNKQPVTTATQKRRWVRRRTVV